MQRYTKFPSEQDLIVVKWVLGQRLIWWPAMVTSIESISTGSSVCKGSLLYGEFDNYTTETADVLFLFSETGQRFVRNRSNAKDTEHREQSVSSWMYHDELQFADDQSVDEETEVAAIPSEMNRSSSRTTAVPVSGPSSRTYKKIPRNSNYQPKKNLRSNKKTVSISHQHQVGVSQGRPQSPIGKQPFSRASSQKARLSAMREQLQGSSSDSSLSYEFVLRENDDEVRQENVPSASRISTENNDIDIRLRLVERQLQDVNKSNNSTLSSTLLSLIVSLRWSLLRALEKPLKNLNLPELSQHGLASHELMVSAQCDYYTFRELAAALSKEHHCNSDQEKYSRVAFSPSYATIQSGSSASDNMNVIFSCLADLASFLRIRDDNDFDSILSKEVVTETCTLLRILGTFTVDPPIHHQTSSGHRNGSTTDVTTNSISATSDASSTIRLLIGLAPVNYVVVNSPESVQINQVDRTFYTSTLLEQECKYFCSSQNCYRTPWNVKHIQSDLAVNCSFDLDHTANREELKKFFIMNWSRQVAPSTVKWSRDIHDSGNNCPGVLRLTIPFIFLSANRNVRSLVHIMDRHIETFMKVRSMIHSRSSFK